MDVAGHRDAYYNTNDQYEEVDIEDQIKATVPKEKKYICIIQPSDRPPIDEED